MSVYNIRSVILSRFDRVEGQLTVFEKVILEGRMVNMGVLLHKDISSSLLELFIPGLFSIVETLNTNL